MCMCIYVCDRSYKHTEWADDLIGFRNVCSKEMSAVQKVNLHHWKAIFGKGEENGITLMTAARGANCQRGSKMAAQL
jgi:hypothetical protein